jgi:hypothetical protein
MLKVLSNKVFSFSRGERDSKGHLLRNKTTIGFCDLPDWVEETDLYKLAVKEGSIQPVTSTTKSENFVKQNDEIEKLRAEVEALKQKNFMLEDEAKKEVEPVEEVKKVRKSAAK